MKLRNHGTNTLDVEAEIVHISLHGVWLSVRGTEYFLPYENFPWFQKATIMQVHNVRLQGKDHLYWPDLDVDLELESLSNLEKYPLIYK